MKRLIAIACVVGAYIAVLQAASSAQFPDPRPGNPPAADAGTIARFLGSAEPPLTSYTARRVLSASSMGGRMKASLEAWTRLNPDGTFSFDVIREEGSGLIRSRVLVAALATEQRARNSGETAQSELTMLNYQFQINDDLTGEGFATIRLHPRRKTQMLLNGMVTVRPDDGDMIRVEGSPAKSPSWWTKRVDIVRRYERVAGVRVPVEMRSRADVRIAGESTFSMTYEYELVNGMEVGAGGRNLTAHLAPRF